MLRICIDFLQSIKTRLFQTELKLRFEHFLAMYDVNCTNFFLCNISSHGVHSKAANKSYHNVMQLQAVISSMFEQQLCKSCKIRLDAIMQYDNQLSAVVEISRCPEPIQFCSFSDFCRTTQSSCGYISTAQSSSAITVADIAD